MKDIVIPARIHTIGTKRNAKNPIAVPMEPVLKIYDTTTKPTKAAHCPVLSWADPQSKEIPNVR
jgi:hypothetical protein